MGVGNCMWAGVCLFITFVLATATSFEDSSIEKRSPGLFHAGLGKRSPASLFHAGLGKRFNKGFLHAGLGKRALFHAGLGKKAALFHAGLGKRTSSLFHAGLGKRSRYADAIFNTGLGKRVDPNELELIGLGKRFSPNMLLTGGNRNRILSPDYKPSTKRKLQGRLMLLLQAMQNTGLGKRGGDLNAFLDNQNLGDAYLAENPPWRFG